ncbi:MAG: PaaI family thioesterase [Pseudomonadota bacterium]
MTSIGAKMGDLTEGTAQILAPVSDGFTQQQGFAHGGLVFSVGDSAAGYAALSVMPLDTEVMTAELKINFLAAASGNLIAQGRVLKPGKRLVIVAADVWAVERGRRKHVAALQGTMVPVSP